MNTAYTCSIYFLSKCIFVSKTPYLVQSCIKNMWQINQISVNFDHITYTTRQKDNPGVLTLISK